MKVSEIEQFFESWAPRWTAWERDNVGLQVGHRSQIVRRVLVALDVTDEIVREAIQKKCELIISHHPLLFRPPKSISDSDSVGALALSLAENGIALYSVHTNLDAATDGVSFALANAVGVQNPRFLAPLQETLTKLAVFVPAEHVDRVAAAMEQAGAGVIGEYESCSFRVEGTGTFRGSNRAHPFSGKPMEFEEVREIRLEMIVPRARIDAVVDAIKSVHPYEEVAYDVYALQNPNPNFGMGVIGDLKRPVPLRSFLNRLKKAVRAESVRYTGSLTQQIGRVAVCGGSGSELLDHAIKSGADAFVTADVKYHPFQSAAGRIVLIDAGHWETEQIVLPVIAGRLRAWAKSRDKMFSVSVTQLVTNPIHSY